jgi:sensor c-di-GMP phosphodiesterase-like protein
LAKAKRHRWQWIGFFLGGGLAGGLIALVAALMLLYSAATSQLESYASEFLEQDERIAANVDQTLATANRSVAPACSDADLALLRNLLFQSPYLKDVGRVQGDFLMCSAVAGKLAQPIRSAAIAVTKYKGRDIYYNVDLQVAKGHRAEVVADGKSNVVISPDVFSDFSRPPMLFAGAFVDRQKREVLQLYGNSSTSMPLDLLLSDQIVRKDGILYYPQCSKTRPDCVLTALPMRSIWEPNYLLIGGFLVVGAAIGLAFASSAWTIHRRKRNLANQLRRGLKRRELWVVYQPIVNVLTTAITGCEALVRWNDEEQQPVRSDIFIGIAEEGGFIGEITTFVLEQVLTEIGDLLRGRQGFRVSVNLSAKDLADETFLPRLEALLAARRIPAVSVGLELTERSTANKEVAIRAIRELRERGHVVSLDDFGTGYSSLSYLHELGVDVLKIDRAFTNTIGTDSITASIVPQILSMAHALKLKIVVEGVEQQAQVDYLRKYGGGDIQAQGWFFGRPVPAQDLRVRLREQGISG